MEKEVGRLEKGSHLWVVKEYSRHRRDLGFGKSIESNEFSAGGHRWAIVLFPQGRRSFDSGYASLYVTLRTKTEGNTPLQILYELYVLKGNNEVWGFSQFKTNLAIPCLRVGEFSGYSCFMKREALESSDYLRDDCFRIYCTVGVLSCPIPNHPLLRFTPASRDYEYDQYLKHICSSWFRKLVGCLNSPSTAARGRLHEKILSAVKGSSVGKGYKKLQKKDD